jgi:CopG family transcriptional regulator, nickel-responsive regulator
VFLKGPTVAVRAFADSIRAERGVAYGQINLITVESGDKHPLAAPHQHHGHMHLTPVA